MYIVYLRGFENKPKPKYLIPNSILDKEYKKGVYDRKNNLPNRYLKTEK